MAVDLPSFVDVESVFLLQALKGCSLSIVAGLVLFNGGPAGRDQLAYCTGYSPPTVQRALEDLELRGLVGRLGWSSWVLTSKAKQLSFVALLESDGAEDVKSFNKLACSSSSLINHGHEVKQQLLPEDVKNFNKLEAERLTDVLVGRCGCARRWAEPAVREALERGDFPGFVEWNMLRWLAYCGSPQEAREKGIRNRGSFIASKVRTGDAVPDDFVFRPSALDQVGQALLRDIRVASEQWDREAEEAEAEKEGSGDG